MISNPELTKELLTLKNKPPKLPMWFDVKGKQLRIVEILPNNDHLEIRLNHPISVCLDQPIPILFKGGEDESLLVKIEEDGKKLIFEGGPYYTVRPGESIHVRHPSLKVGGPMFIEEELRKIEQVRKFGFKNYFLSYVSDQKYVDSFLDLVGKDCVVKLKIEDLAGLNYVKTQFVKRDNLILVAARGDLFIEVDRPHDILAAMKLIIDHDPQACLGSRLLLSIVQRPVPSCADLSELAWLYDIGYREMMLCDELCLKGDLLSTAINVFDCFRKSYERPVTLDTVRRSLLSRLFYSNRV